MIKTCSICKQVLHISSFYTNGAYKGKTKYRAVCKTCFMKFGRDRKILLIKEVYAEVFNKPFECSICGYNRNYSVLEFHHLNPEDKEFAISDNQNPAKEKLKKEISKCILVCANCHTEIHNPDSLL